MKTKKLAFTIIALILALSIIAASNMAAIAHEIEKGDTVAFYSGRAGVSFTESQYTGVVRLTRPDDSSFGATNHPKFTKSLVTVRLTKANGEQVKFILGSVYVFYIVKASEVRAWKEGELGLYYLDGWKNEWKECGSFLVNGNEGKPRIACRMRLFGTYGLAEK
jgi:hypothetical protein